MTEKEPDSSFFHSACQIVLEKEAEGLKVLRSRWTDKSLYHNDKATKRASGEAILLPRNLTTQKEVSHQSITIKRFYLLLFIKQKKTL